MAGELPDLLQDHNRDLARWLSSRLDAMQSARSAVEPLVVALEDAPAVVALSQTAIDALEAKGEFPRRRKLSPRRVGYLRRELLAWVESRPVSDLLPVRRAGQQGD